MEANDAQSIHQSSGTAQKHAAPYFYVGLHNRKIMHIRVATTDIEIADCFPVMRELRPHIAENQFLSRIRSQINSGYRLAFVQVTDSVVAVAGFRVGENLAWGRFLYVDDLVTHPAHRSPLKGLWGPVTFVAQRIRSNRRLLTIAPRYWGSKKRSAPLL